MARGGIWPGYSLRYRWAVIGLVALGVGLPAVLGVLSGSILIPHNDDPNYRRVALTLFQTESPL